METKLQNLFNEIVNYISQRVIVDNDSPLTVKLGSIEKGDSSVIVTLIRIEEESSMKNFPNETFNRGSNRIENQKSKVYLNYYLMFSSKYSYAMALLYIQSIIQYFQFYKTYEHENFKARFDLYSPSFEELNSIWSYNGGTQYPCVIYKVSVDELVHGEILETSVIQKINTSFKSINQ